MNKLFLSFFITAFIAIGIFQINNNLITTKPNTKKEKKEKYDRPDKAAQWLHQLRQTPKGNNSPAQLNKQIKLDIDNLALLKSKNKANGDLNVPKFKFENLGPSNFGGRVRGFVIKSDNPDELLAGAVSGGVFKSENGGQSWESKEDFLPTLAIGSLIGDPDNSNRVYAGTGEGFFNSDAARGAGIFISDDFGENWGQLTSTDNENFYYVNRMVRIPSSNILIAATRKGVFRSDDLGQTWIETSNHVANSRGFVDLKINPSNPNHLLTSHYGFSNNILNLNITSPTSIIGDYLAIPAGFGPDFPIIGTGNKTLLLVDDGTSTTQDGCEAITNDVVGKIALIQRGACNFTVKVKNAQDAGAEAVIVFQNNADGPFTMGGEDDDITIPSAMISLEDGELITTETGLINANVIGVVSDILGRFVMQSTDAGVSWQILNDNNGLPEKNVGRMELAFGSDGVVYIAVANNDDETLGLWRSSGLGVNYSKTASNTEFIERQGWYDLTIAVHPTNSNTVFIGAIDQYKTTNAGVTINKTSNWAPESTNNDISRYVHADHHGYFFTPNNPNHFYVVCDGGIYKTENNGTSFFDLNNGLSISQPYGIAVSPNGQRLTSGTQDNGSQIYFGDNNSWIEWHGGDGGYSAWDQQNGLYLYGSTPEGGMFGSANAGTTTSEMELPDTDGASFIQPFAIDPNNGNKLIVGTNNVFYTSNARSLSDATFTDITDDLASGSVSALTFNPNTSTQIVVGMSGGNLYKVNNVGSTNTLIEITPNDDSNLGSLTGSITDIKFDSNDTSGNTIYITRANYAVDRILKSTDGGSTWHSIAGDLPDMPLFQVSIDPTDATRIFVGSELGLWVANIDGNNTQWIRYHYGLAFTRVVDLVWFEDDTLYVATHGRGTFRATRNAIDLTLNKFITISSSNDDDGIIDLGESGLMMLNLKNTSGFEVNNISLNLDTNTSLIFDETNITVPSIQPFSSVIVPVKTTLEEATCSNGNPTHTNFNATLSYANVTSENNLQVLTAANANATTDDFVENAENLINQMIIETKLGGSPWRRASDSANTGTQSWFTTDEGQYSDKSLISPWLVMNEGGNKLDFALKYSTEGDTNQLWDGVVLEIREKAGLWTDIGHLSTVAYDGQLFTNNTAQARFAWAGSHNSWRVSSVNLSETYKGKTIQFRFRMVSDSNTGSAGFWVDDIKMSNVIWNKPPTCDEAVSTGGKIPNKGIWFDRSRNGHGFVIEPIGRDNLYFTVFYTYEDDGTPEWYTSLSTLENGVLNINFSADTLLRFIYDFTIDPSVEQAHKLDPDITDGRLSINFNSNDVINSTACQNGATGRPVDLIALAKWKINDQEGEWCIEPIIAEQNKGFPDISGNWYGGTNDAGWGISYAVAKTQLVATMYYYDETGQPRWAIGQQDGFEIGKNLTTQMRQVTGFGRLQPTTETIDTNAGTINTRIDNMLNNLQIDGTATINLEYQGIEGGQWIRNDIPIAILTKPH